MFDTLKPQQTLQQVIDKQPKMSVSQQKLYSTTARLCQLAAHDVFGTQELYPQQLDVLIHLQEAVPLILDQQAAVNHWLGACMQ